MGGSGKTPFIQALASRYPNSAIVLRGYKRKSEGTIVVSHNGDVLTDVETSGDEAMMLARSLPKCSVVVSEDRAAGIQKAKEIGANVVFLDDAFHKNYKKFDILIDVDTKNRFCLPSGPYRLPHFFIKYANLVVKEGKDFTRKVWIEHPTPKMILLTAIANPDRLTPFLPPNIAKYRFADHHFFTEKELKEIWQKDRPTSFLVTEKDSVKLKKFSYPLSLLRLELEIEPFVYDKVDQYIKEYHAKKDTNSSNPS